VALDEVHGISGPATIATIIRSITIDDLLLRERKKLAMLKEVGTLEGNNSGESPAGTALLLILDGIDSTLVTPIEVVGKTISNLNISTSNISRNSKRNTVTILIRETIPAIRGSIDLIELTGTSHVLNEDSITTSLLIGIVDLAELLLVSNPERIVLVGKCKGTS